MPDILVLNGFPSARTQIANPVLRHTLERLSIRPRDVRNSLLAFTDEGAVLAFLHTTPKVPAAYSVCFVPTDVITSELGARLGAEREVWLEKQTLQMDLVMAFIQNSANEVTQDIRRALPSAPDVQVNPVVKVIGVIGAMPELVATPEPETLAQP